MKASCTMTKYNLQEYRFTKRFVLSKTIKQKKNENESCYHNAYVTILVFDQTLTYSKSVIIIYKELSRILQVWTRCNQKAETSNNRRWKNEQVKYSTGEQHHITTAYMFQWVSPVLDAAALFNDEYWWDGRL